MAILSVVEFQKAFDPSRVTQLASDYDEVQAEPVYDETIVSAVLLQAEAFIKAALSKQYSTTELEADKAIERVCADVAMYYMEFRRNQFTPAVEAGFERAKRFLRDLQDGTAKLGAVAQLLPTGPSEAPTEAIEDASEFLYLTDDEQDLL